MPNAKLDATPLPFGEQIRYFAKKINLPTDSYADIDSQLHDYAFVVAGANTMQMVQDFRQIVDKAINEGITLEQFKKDFGKIAPNWHRGRSRTVYDTNLYSSYNYGRYEQQKQLADVMPYWQYQHHDNTHPRPEHQRLDNLVLRADDPFWDDYYPTKAYGCHCTVQALDEMDLQNQGLTVSDSPQIEWEEKTVGIRSGNPKTVRVPKGVDVGFEHKKRLVPVQNIDQILLHKIAQSKTDIAFVAKQTRTLMSNPAIMSMMNQSMEMWVGDIKKYLDNGKDKTIISAVPNFKYVGAVPTEVLDSLPIRPQSAMIAIDKGQMIHALRSLKEEKGIVLPVEFWTKLPENIQRPDAILRDHRSKTPALLFVYKSDKGKLVIKMDYYAEATDSQPQTKTIKTKMNMVVTGSLLLKETSWVDLKNSYQLLYGSL